MADPKKPMQLADAAKRNLQAVMTRFTTSSVRDMMFDRMEYIDRLIQREANRSPEYLKARVAQRQGKKRVIGEMEVPVVLSQIDTAHARLVGLFLSGRPIFGSTSENESLQDVALMLTSLSKRDQQRFGFIPQLTLCLSDTLRYLYCAAEVEYTERKRYSVKTGAEAASLESVAYRGNSIKRLDPYNIFFDTTVPLHEVSTRGAYAGYVEALNYINAKLMLQELNPAYALRENNSSALSATVPESRYRRPDVSQPLEVKDSNNWTSFWGQHARNANNSGHDGKYEVVTLYAKLIPQEYGIRMQKDGTPTIFKLKWLNGVLIYVEPLEAAHGQLPIVIGCGYDDGLGLMGKSPAEQLADFQEILSSLINATFVSMRRAVSDRALFDPQRIKPTDINSENPAAKIPVRLNQFNKDLSSAYYQIPYQDTITPNFLQNFAFIQSLANQVTGLNPAAQGTFVKGNRTQSEYMDVQSNSDSRGMKFALGLEYTFFGQIKHIMKMNYLQYAEEEELIMKDSEHNVKIDPVALRQRELDFDMTDGLEPASKTVNAELLIAAMNGISQMPQLDMRYSRARMFVHMLKSQGLNLEAFKSSPAEQQLAQQMLLQNGAPQ